jgi:hypothetical protein
MPYFAGQMASFRPPVYLKIPTEQFLEVSGMLWGTGSDVRREGIYGRRGDARKEIETRL